MSRWSSFWHVAGPAVRGWLVGIVCVGLAYGIVGQRIDRLQRLSREFVVTSGRVEAVYPHQHNTFVYSFAVAGKRYEGSGRGGDMFRQGEKIAVYYSPADPDNSTNMDPVEEYIGERNEFVRALVVLPLFFGLGTWLLRRLRTAGTRR